MIALGKTLLAAALALATTSLTAQAYVSDGTAYEASCNADGYVLTSKTPVDRKVGSETVPGIEKIYFGKSCDAFHPLLGKGRWCWANGGFLAEFPGHSFGFARQELSCPEGGMAPGTDSGSCGC